MKRAWTFLMFLCLLLSLAACSENPVDGSTGDDIGNDISGGNIEESIGGEDIEESVGGDWHVWGLYDFETVDGLEIAIDKQDNEAGQCLGYDIYEDGDTLGELLVEIRPEDGGYRPEDIETDIWAFCDAHGIDDEMETGSFFLYGDYNGDGLTDIGVPIKSGDVMWYVQGKDRYEYPLFTFAETQPVDPAKELEWRTWKEYRFETLSDGLTLAITTRGSEGWETGFDIYADPGEGEPRGQLLGSLYWGDALYERAYFDLSNCLVFEDHSGDGLIDIGLESIYGDTLWYFRDENDCFTYAETEMEELPHLAGKWELEDDEPESGRYWYEIDATGRKFSFYIDTLEYDGIILPAGEENGCPRYEIVENHGGMRDWLYLVSENQLQQGVLEPGDDYVMLYSRTD